MAKVGVLSSILVAWLAVYPGIHAQEVIFGNDADVGSTCTTNDGRRGRCVEIEKCPEVQGNFLTNPPAHCGFNGFFPIVCCPVNTDAVSEDPINGLVSILDISPPDLGSEFVCGKSAVTFVFDSIRSKRSSPFLGSLPHFKPPKTPEFPVIGGFDAKRNAWPWMALLGTKDDTGNTEWFCAGALINDQWILTAAHCTDIKIPSVVRLGEHDYSDDHDGASHKDFGIQQIVPHPNYTYPAAYHDLALLQLLTKVTFQTYTRPVCLPWGDESQTDLTEKKVKLTGWGDTEFFGSPSSILQEVDITVFPNSECQKSYSELRDFPLTWPNGIGEETTCAGDRNGGRDACQGDSGGPIIYSLDDKYIIKGVVSRGYGCGHKNYPGIYANVQYPPYLAWIKRIAF